MIKFNILTSQDKVNKFAKELHHIHLNIKSVNDCPLLKYFDDNVDIFNTLFDSDNGIFVDADCVYALKLFYQKDKGEDIYET